MIVGMNKAATEVLEAALALPDDERAKLAELLIESLDGAPDAGQETAWAAEIERRLERIEAGVAKSLPMEEALARLHRAARGP